MAFYRESLKLELAARQERNARYSLRAFAKSLGTSPATLSQIFAGRANLSLKTARRMVDALALGAEDARSFVASVITEQAHASERRVADLVKDAHAACTPVELAETEMRVIADWYHFAILELSLVEGFRSDPRWIARQLGITTLEARNAIGRLAQLGLLVAEDGRLRKATTAVSNKDKHAKTSDALKRHMRQQLERAIVSLETDPLPQRCMSTMTMPVDVEKLPLVKAKIETFVKELTHFAGDERKTAVYQLAVGFFPQQRREACG